MQVAISAWRSFNSRAFLSYSFCVMASTSTTGSSTTSSPGTILTITLLMLVDAGSNLGLALLQLTRFFVVFLLRNGLDFYDRLLDNLVAWYDTHHHPVDAGRCR